MRPPLITNGRPNAIVWGQRGQRRPGRAAQAFRSFTGLVPKASETGDSDRKGQAMSKAGSSLLRTTLVRAADTARTQDPQLARIYYVQMVERGKNHIGALCVVASSLAERAWAVMNRQMPDVICDTDGTPVTTQPEPPTCMWGAGRVGLRSVASGGSSVGLARESPAAFGLALPGCASWPATGCGLAQQRTGLVRGSRSRHADRGSSSCQYHGNGENEMIIGVDPHKSSHTATALSPATNTPVARGGSTRRGAAIASCCDGPSSSSSVVGRSRVRGGWGRHLAQWLVARGETVLDVPSTATARVRELSRGGRRKTDVIDAAAAACVAALQGDASPVAGEDHTTGFALVEERRGNLAAQRVRVANQLHAVLRDLVPGGAELQITARSASTMLRSIRPASQCERTRKELAHDLVRDLRAVVGQSRMEPDFAGRRVRSRSYFLRAEAQRGGGDELGRVGWSLAVSS